MLNVKRDDTTKRIIYSVSEEYCKRSSPVDGRGNFVVVDPHVSGGNGSVFIRSGRFVNMNVLT